MHYLIRFGWMIWLGLVTVSLGMNEPLPLEEAFKPTATLAGEKVKVEIQMAETIHLTKESLKFSVAPSELFSVGSVVLPGAQKDDFGDEIYSGLFSVEVPIVRSGSEGGTVQFALNYQGCSDRGICYPPASKTYTFTLEPKAGAGMTTAQKTQQAAAPLSEADAISKTLGSGNLWLILLTFFGFGLLLSMTPCIFPMIPILSSIIVSQGQDMTARRGFTLSLVYVLAMAVAYTMAGVLAGLFGANIQAALQNPWVISVFALVFVALAFSMFGFYEIGLPASWQSRLNKTSDEAGSKGGIVGVGVMGFLSALIVGPCVAPPLAGALVYIGQTGDALLGGAALFVMSLGMGAPLLLIGLGAGRYMPKPGGWMTAVTKVFGVIMLAIAVWMLSRIVPEGITLFLWALLMIGSSVYLGALESLGEKRGFNALCKGFGIVLLVYGVMLFVGSVSGATNPLKPLEAFEGSGGGVAAAQTQKLTFETVDSPEALKRKIADTPGAVMVDFTAQWCVSCRELEENTFKDASVIRALDKVTRLQVDVTDNTAAAKAMMRAYGVYGPPAILFFVGGAEKQAARIVGYKDPDAFLANLKGVL